MPKRRPMLRPRHWTKLQLVQMTHPLLGSGIPTFVDDDERRQCWLENRERMLAEVGPNYRPVGWWLFESPEPRDHGMDETAQLRRMGLVPVAMP